MRLLRQNQTVFYYAIYKGKKVIVDDYGNQTGEYDLTYSDPIKCFGNISPAKGELNTRYFGESEDYDKVILLPKDTLIDEYSILWVDSFPSIKGNIPHDYIIKRVAKSLNHVSLAISKVKVVI